MLVLLSIVPLLVSLVLVRRQNRKIKEVISFSDYALKNLNDRIRFNNCVNPLLSTRYDLLLLNSRIEELNDTK
jgi:hypothetical protein